MQYWKTRTFVQICYLHDKQIEQVNSYFDCQTFYDNLWLYLFLLQIRSILLQFMTFYDFMTACVSFAFIKEEHFGRTYIQLLFSRSFLGVFHFCRTQIAFQRFPGVSRSSGHPVANIPPPPLRLGGEVLFSKFRQKEGSWKNCLDIGELIERRSSKLFYQLFFRKTCFHYYWNTLFLCGKYSCLL